MFDRILVPTDGSGPANAALEYAGEIAAVEATTVHVLHVRDPDADPADVEALLEDSREWASETDGPIVDSVETGEPRDAILEAAAEHDVDAIVMGTRGRQGVGRLILGSVTESIVRDAPVPVLVVRGAADVRRRYPLETIVVPTDGSGHASAALERALTVANHHDATVHLLSVVDVTPAAIDERDDLRLDRLERHAQSVVGEEAAGADRAGIETETAVKYGSAHRTIRSYVDDVEADLLVMGTHGRSGLDRLLLGSVTERVLRQATVPVLTVRAAGGN
ncbi:universal stress protein [Natronolimnohabitans innermongolicus]|uniref:UspA domain-containing protein n=1 Tax=Natronolimnohabitans innermongolicus JCM 12255 TaxID=1227499 RepID=L9WSS5_9EURY|nr:universal stress protein [Natronolimnohabitans innermongolicus]ELY52514.1 UspA domain-containing protein [Natronolimnohabitans innermongolicus JCM 12255]